MPFRVRANEQMDVDYDEVYARVIAPAVDDAGLRAHRADEETLGGVFHKTMFERLALCEYAVADLSSANPNVFYELGVRHALRPWSTVLMFRDGVPLPLDVAEATAIPYTARIMDDAAEIALLRSNLTRRLVDARLRRTDSPVHQLVAGLPVPDVDHRRVDLMLDAIERESEVAQTIASAAKSGIETLRQVRSELGAMSEVESESVVGLLLAFRSVNGWQEMIEIVDSMAPELAEVWLVQEQQALALARLSRFDESVEILNALIRRRPNAESFGLLGGTFKRHWRAVRGVSPLRSVGLLNRAADAYKRGFEIDLRDPYPGVNAVTLLRRAGRTDEADELAPVVRFCVRRRLALPDPEYWDYACAIELALLTRESGVVERYLADLVTDMSELFRADTMLEGLEDMEALMLDPEARRDLSTVRAEVEARRAELMDER
ncbi:hypothetical protein BA895_11625 [Humibacillus sp. DSM 29435]|nr:hypothetical protein BA895_11625 [Humibacillus sp. DSM 29435]